MTPSLRPASTGSFRHAKSCGMWIAALLVLAAPWDASAQTWAGVNRQRPSLREIAAIDETGEANWLWGREDVAGDGLDQFSNAERAIDARSVYLRVEDNRLWWRTYVSATSTPELNLTAYLFVDADLDTRTGRTAAAPEVDPAFTADPTAGGYDYVVSVRGDGTQATLWELNAPASAFVQVPTTANQLDGEANAMLDPLRIGSTTNGYVQAWIANAVLAVDARCQARFYVRTTNQTQSLGAGDLDVGEVIGCAAPDTNANDVPDPLEPVAECTSDAQCPNAGICWRGRCWLAPVCFDDADCSTAETCVEGACIVTAGTNCQGNADCASGVYENGRCIACTSDVACGTGRICGPDGRCVDENVAGPGAGGAGSGNGTAGAYGIVLGEGERIQGGPCACRYVSERAPNRLIWLGLGSVLLLARRRRATRRGQSA